MSRGQYSRPDGMFFGGSREAWSNTTFKKIIAQLLTKSVRHLAVIDLHAGLGPAGYGEPICPGTDLVEYFRVLKWFGPEVTSTVKGDSASASLTGRLADRVRACAGSICSTYIAIEYGTIPVMEVFKALRADNWLHAYSDQSDPRWAATKKGIRDAFYVDESWWKAAVYRRSVDMIPNCDARLTQASSCSQDHVHRSPVSTSGARLYCGGAWRRRLHRRQGEMRRHPFNLQTVHRYLRACQEVHIACPKFLMRDNVQGKLHNVHIQPSSGPPVLQLSKAGLVSIDGWT